MVGRLIFDHLILYLLIYFSFFLGSSFYDSSTQFFSSEDTQIPALQKWCHELAAPNHIKAVKKAVDICHGTHSSILNYHNSIIRSQQADRKKMLEMWRSRSSKTTSVSKNKSQISNSIFLRLRKVSE